MRRASLLALLVSVVSCNGTTGYDLVQFYAAGRGFSDAVKGRPYTFDAPGGVHVTLTQASLHVGALYLTQSVPQAGGGPQSCTLPQTYEGAFVGEVRGEGDIDLLDPGVQQLHVIGDGSTIPAATGQVWLTHDSAITAGDLDGPDGAPVLMLQGSYDDAKGKHTFSAAITIDTNRLVAPANSGLPGEAEICKSRIVSGIPAVLTVAQGGTLVLGIDAAPLFVGVPFSDLPAAATVTTGCLPGVTTDVCFSNDATAFNVSSNTLFTNLTGSGPYAFGWLPSAP